MQPARQARKELQVLLGRPESERLVQQVLEEHKAQQESVQQALQE